MEPVRVMAWKFARSASCVEFEELYSIGMTKVCEVVAGPLWQGGRGYLIKSAENAMIEELRRVSRHLTVVSLDAPTRRSDDGSSSLADILPDHSHEPVEQMESVRVCAVREALMSLSARRRGALLYRYGFEGYGELTAEEIARVVGSRSKDSAVTLGCDARRVLRKDERLRAALGLDLVEVRA
jgi:DNA-directed RNA polymerase specialized sigma24 family protein